MTEQQPQTRANAQHQNDQQFGAGVPDLPNTQCTASEEKTMPQEAKAITDRELRQYSGDGLSREDERDLYFIAQAPKNPLGEVNLTCAKLLELLKSWATGFSGQEVFAQSTRSRSFWKKLRTSEGAMSHPDLEGMSMKAVGQFVKLADALDLIDVQRGQIVRSGKWDRLGNVGASFWRLMPDYPDLSDYLLDAGCDQ